MDYKSFYYSDDEFRAFLPTKMDYPIISGHEYFKLCDWNLCPRYKIDFNSEKIDTDDKVFMNLDHIENYIAWFNLYPPKNKFIAVFHNSDLLFQESHYFRLKKWISKFYTINNSVYLDDVVSIPLGFNDATAGIVDKLNWKIYHDYTGAWVKDKLCLSQFWKSPSRPDRYRVYKIFEDQKWVDTFDEGDWQDIEAYYERLKGYKYQLCPPGAGLDTHRFYESLLFDVIPITVETFVSPIQSQFPTYIFQKWENISSEELGENYELAKNQLNTWKALNPNWMLATNWIK